MLIKIFTLCNNFYNRRQLRKGHAEIGKSCLCGRIRIINIGGGKITIGDNCRINSGKGHNPIGGDTVCRFVSYGGRICIGDRVGISNSTIVSRNSVIIEDNVFIGGSCKIYDNDFHPISMEKRISFFDDIPNKPVLIKRGAFIGAHSIVLKGVIVGEGAVVGAGSVVTGNIPDGEIWAGNPARFIKKLRVTDR